MSGGDRFRRVFYGYWVFLGCAMLHAFSSDEYFYGFSVFYAPILLEYGWSMALDS